MNNKVRDIANGFWDSFDAFDTGFVASRSYHTEYGVFYVHSDRANHIIKLVTKACEESKLTEGAEIPIVRLSMSEQTLAVQIPLQEFLSLHNSKAECMWFMEIINTVLSKSRRTHLTYYTLENAGDEWMLMYRYGDKQTPQFQMAYGQWLTLNLIPTK